MSATVSLPFSPGQTVWQVSATREITLNSAFSSGGNIIWNASYGDESFMVSEKDIKAVPKLEKPLGEGDKILINKVPATVIRDAFPNMPGGKGVVARRIVEDRNRNGDYRSLDDLIARMGLSQVDWHEIGKKLDFGN